MTEEEPTAARAPVMRQWWFLGMLATLALAIAVACGIEIIASISWCGVFGCSFGGGQPIHSAIAFVYAGLAAVIVAVPVFAFPWTRWLWLRLGVGVLVLAYSAYFTVGHILAMH